MNGCKKYIVINFYREEDGKQKISNFMLNELLRKKDEIDVNLSVDVINEQLNTYYGSIPDPDLALYFGHVQSTYGFLPWQIRLTEFFKIDNSYKKDLKLRKFIDVLFKFAKVQQRFGK
jgi:dehydrodolichyl diphosphate syntase complex subunit NUS1